MSSQLVGSLTARNAGGNSTFPTFMDNPQYKVHVHFEPEKPIHSPITISPISPSSSKRSGGYTDLPERKKQTKAQLRIVIEGPRSVPFNIMLLWRNEKESGERVLQ